MIDTLDGTREFVKGNGEFTVNAALIREEDDREETWHELRTVAASKDVQKQ